MEFPMRVTRYGILDAESIYGFVRRSFMFIHIGDDVVIPLDDIIAIVNVEAARSSEDTRRFLKTAEDDGFVMRISHEEPKSIILTESDRKSILYYSPISSLTLCKRSGYMDTL